MQVVRLPPGNMSYLLQIIQIRNTSIYMSHVWEVTSTTLHSGREYKECLGINRRIELSLLLRPEFRVKHESTEALLLCMSWASCTRTEDGSQGLLLWKNANFLSTLGMVHVLCAHRIRQWRMFVRAEPAPHESNAPRFLVAT